jgi:hypothetical protein
MAPIMYCVRKILICLLISIALPSYSQGRDTVFAIHKLFQQRRGGGTTWAATGLETAYDESLGWRSIRSTSENAHAAAFNGGIPFLLGMRQMQHFSINRERAIIKRYNEGWSIPRDIRRKLRRKHFHRTSRDIP